MRNAAEFAPVIGRRFLSCDRYCLVPLCGFERARGASSFSWEAVSPRCPTTFFFPLLPDDHGATSLVPDEVPLSPPQSEDSLFFPCNRYLLPHFSERVFLSSLCPALLARVSGRCRLPDVAPIGRPFPPFKRDFERAADPFSPPIVRVAFSQCPCIRE